MYTGGNDTSGIKEGRKVVAGIGRGKVNTTSVVVETERKTLLLTYVHGMRGCGTGRENSW